MQQYILKNRNWNRFFFFKNRTRTKTEKIIKVPVRLHIVNKCSSNRSFVRGEVLAWSLSVCGPRAVQWKKKKNYSRIRMVSSEHYRFGCQQSNYNNDSFVGLSRANVLKSSTTRSENYYHANYNVTSFCLLQCIAALYYRRRVLIFFL